MRCQQHGTDDGLPGWHPLEVKLYDRPSFRFGNGLSQRATSRVDAKSRSMGWISFYLLDGSAQETPPLLGGRELHERRAIVAYNGDFLAHRDDEYTWWTSRLYHLRGRHVAIDLSEKPRHLHQTLHDLQHPPDDSGSPDGDGPGGSGDHDGRDSDRSRSRPSTGSQPGVHELVRQASIGGGVHSVERISETEEEVQNRQRSPRADVSASSCMSFGSVLMVAEDVHAPVHEGDARQQLQQLAQRLLHLRDRIHGNGSPGSSRARSTAERMAMRRSPSPGTRKEQSICSLAKLQEMRPSSQLCHKDQRPRGNEILGTTSLLGGTSTAGAANGLRPGRDEREDLQRQGDGVEGSPVGGQSWAGQHVDPDQSLRPNGSKDSGQGDHNILDEEHGCHHNSSPEIDKKYLTDSGGTENSRCDAKCACCEGEGKSILNASTSAGDCGGRRVAAGRDGSSRGLDGLWASLKALRERMSLGGSNAERLEADRHQSQPTKEAQHFHSQTFEAVPASTNSMAADILSVKNSFTREILPPLAKRLAKAAALTSVLMAPVYELVNAVESKIDMMEIACSPTSSLTSAFEADGFTCFRVNHLSDFNLDTQEGHDHAEGEDSDHGPKLAWVSLPCTRLSALQLLTPRDEEAWSRFEKKRGQDLRRASEVADALEPVIAETDFAWEWPITAVAGWRSRAIEKLEKLAKKHNRTIYRIRIHGCAYGLQWRGVPLRKGWQILTTSKEMWLMVNKRCSKDHDHAECRGEAAKASSYYPDKLCAEVVKAMKHQWLNENKSLIHFVERDLLEVEEPQEPELVFALSRSNLNLQEAPTGRKLEAIKQLMLRVHRAAGHPGFSNLQRMLEARGSPRWAVELAGTLECAECKEASRPKLMPPASSGEEPQLFEVLGSDVFEYRMKVKRRNIGAFFGGIVHLASLCSTWCIRMLLAENGRHPPKTSSSPSPSGWCTILLRPGWWLIRQPTTRAWSSWTTWASLELGSLVCLLKLIGWWDQRSKPLELRRGPWTRCSARMGNSTFPPCFSWQPMLWTRMWGPQAFRPISGSMARTPSTARTFHLALILRRHLVDFWKLETRWRSSLSASRHPRSSPNWRMQLEGLRWSTTRANLLWFGGKRWSLEKWKAIGLAPFVLWWSKVPLSGWQVERPSSGPSRIRCDPWPSGNSCKLHWKARQFSRLQWLQKRSWGLSKGDAIWMSAVMCPVREGCKKILHRQKCNSPLHKNGQKLMFGSSERLKGSSTWCGFITSLDWPSSLLRDWPAVQFPWMSWLARGWL